MKITVNGQVFPKVWGIANSVKKLRTQRRQVNIGGGTVGFPIFEVELPEETRKEGLYLITPQGVRLYYFPRRSIQDRISDFRAGLRPYSRPPLSRDCQENSFLTTVITYEPASLTQ